MPVVADSGPLIALAKVNRLDLLRRLYRSILTGPAVFTEVVTAGLATKAFDAALLNDAYVEGWMQVRGPVRPTLSASIALHTGELESISLAIESDADWVLIDDLVARRVAETTLRAAGCRTNVKGTLGVVVTARAQNLLSKDESIEVIRTFKLRPDIWLDARLCDTVIGVLQTM